MSGATGTLAGLLTELSIPALILQLGIVAVVVLLGFVTRYGLRLWHAQHAGRVAPYLWQARLLEGAVIETPVLLALLLLLMVRTVTASLGFPTEVLDTAMELATVLFVVRLGTYLLRLVVGPQSWMRTWEQRLTLFIWLVCSFELVGWFGTIEQALDSVNLIGARGHFSLWSLLKGLVILSAFVLVSSLIARAIERRVMRVGSLALSTRIGIIKFTYFFVVSLGILLGINAAGVDFTALTVLTGAIGIGLGFGLQSITSNFISGFVLLMDKSIKPGDVISFTGMSGTSTESFGWVQELRGRYVVLRDRDGIETLVPNQSLITNSVINWSYSDRKVRLKLPVRISYRDDPEVALAVLLRATANNPRILREPTPVSRLMQFGDHGMDLELRFWIADPEGGVNNVRSDVNREIYRLFKESGITIPIAQREIHVLNHDQLP